MKNFLYFILFFIVSCGSTLRISKCTESKSDLIKLEDKISKEIQEYYIVNGYSEDAVKKYLSAECLNDTTIKIVVWLKDGVEGHIMVDKSAKIISVTHKLPVVI